MSGKQQDRPGAVPGKQEDQDGMDMRDIRGIKPMKMIISSETAESHAPRQTDEMFDLIAAEQLKAFGRELIDKRSERNRFAEEMTSLVYSYSAQHDTHGILSKNGSSAVYLVRLDEYCDDLLTDGSYITQTRYYACMVFDRNGVDVYRDAEMGVSLYPEKEDQLISTSLSPDGRFLLYTDTKCAWLVDMMKKRNRFLMRHAAATFSPDGTAVVLLTEKREIRIIGTDKDNWSISLQLPLDKGEETNCLLGRESLLTTEDDELLVKNGNGYRVYKYI